MRRVLRHLTITAKLTALGAVAVLSLGAFAATALTTLSAVRIGSPRYQLFSDNNALLADVLPPPEYLVESYLLANQLLAAGRKQDAAEIDRIATYARTLHAQFDDRLGVWEANTTIDRDTRELITKTSAEPAKNFLLLFETELVPDVRRGDLDGAGALLDGRMTEQYTAHRAAVDQIVQRSTAAATTIESSTAVAT